MRVILLVKEPGSGKSQGRVCKLDGAAILIGRGDGELQLRDDQCSRQHALINQDKDGKPVLRDLKSKNGTYANGQKISDTRLEPGMIINIGGTVIEVLEIDGRAKTTPRQHDPDLTFATSDENTASGNTGPTDPNLLNSWPENILAGPKDQQERFKDYFLSNADPQGGKNGKH